MFQEPVTTTIKTTVVDYNLRTEKKYF